MTAFDHIRKEEQDTRKANQFFKKMGLTEKQLEWPNVNLYCKAIVLSKKDILSNKDKKYCADFLRFWQFKQGMVSKKSRKHMYSMIKYYTQKQQNANNKLLRSKLRPNSIKQ